MHGIVGRDAKQSTEIGGRIRPQPEEFFRSGLVGEICRAIWGRNADAKVAALLGVTDRAARDQFSGRVAMHARLLAQINLVLTRRP